jgi:hypothetical protein
MAQSDAGSQPIKVICNIKQITPAIGLFIVKNTKNGTNNARKNLILNLLI